MCLLTIGMPLYNNSATLADTLESLANQTFRDFRVIMSDDVSSDETPMIAEEFSRRDGRFQLVKQEKNLNYGNFRYVLQQASSEFFMFASGDDLWEPTFAERCISALRSEQSAVAAVSKVEFVTNGRVVYLSKGTRALVGSTTENIREYLQDAGDNSRMYGVFRTGAAQAAFPGTNHHAYDHTFSAATLLHGKHLEIDECLMRRDLTPGSRYMEYVRRDGRGLWRLFPLLGMTTTLLKYPTIRRTPAILRALVAANLRFHIYYLRRFHPRYCSVVEPLLNRIIWRL